MRVLRLPKAIIRPAVGKSKGVCENDGEEMLICVEADSTKLSDGLFPYAMELSGYVASPDQIREDTGSDELKSVRQALEQQGLGEWCSQGNFVVISVVSGRYRGLSAVGLGTSKKARARAARLALAATWRTKIPTRNGTAIDDSIGDGVFGSLVEKVRQLLEASALTPIANSDDTPGTRCNLSFPNGGLDVPLPLPLSIGSQFSDQSYGQEKLQGRLVEVQASYQPEGVGYIALRRGDKLKILHSKKEAPGLNDQFSSYVFGKLLDTDEHSADESGFVGWFPLDVVKFI